MHGSVPANGSQDKKHDISDIVDSHQENEKLGYFTLSSDEDDTGADFAVPPDEDDSDFDDIDFSSFTPIFLPEIKLPPERTQRQIQDAQKFYREVVLQVRQATKDRSIEILSLRVTEPQKH